jgi:DNA-directed RNA polymerase subunit H (RpoH/RPB5)
MLKKTIEKFEDDGYKMERSGQELLGSTEDEKIIVKVVTGEKSIGVAIIRALLKRGEKDQVNEIHLVSDSPLTPQAKKMVAEHGIRYLSMKNVLIDMTQHHLVPKHEIVSQDDREQLLKDLGVEASQLPKIRRSDPIVKLLNGKPGDVLRIQRQSPTAGTSIYYRLIIAA